MTPSHQTHEYHADEVLKSLRGYVIRQAWRAEDISIIASILKEWADEVEALEARISELESENQHIQQVVENAGTSISPGYVFASNSNGAS